MSLVNQSRAGTFELRQFYRGEITELQRQSKLIGKRVKHKEILTEEDKAIFYSNWKYSASRLSCDLKRVKKVEDIKKLFGFSGDETKAIFEFLVSTGLILKEKGTMNLGPRSTHIDKKSPFIGDGKHLHHLVSQKIGEKKAVLILMSVSAIFAIVSIFLTGKLKLFSLFILFIVIIISYISVWKKEK